MRMRVVRFFVPLATWTWMTSAAVAASPIEATQSFLNDLARLQELRAINQTEAVLVQGPVPSKWPIRVLVSPKTIDSTLRILEGSFVTVPIGKPQNNRVDGYLKITIDRAHVSTNNAKLGADLSVSIGYDPDLVNLPVGGLSVPVSVKALLLPASQQINQDGLITILKIVPYSISFGTMSSNIEAVANNFLSHLGVKDAITAWGDQLQVSIPSIVAKTPLDISFKSQTTEPFKKGGSTNIQTSLTRSPSTLELAFDRTIVTSSGVWMLGGLPPKPVVINPAAGPPPSQADLEKRRNELLAKLAPFNKPSDGLEISVNKSVMTGFVDKLLGGPPLEISIGTTDSTGTIESAIPIKDNVLGDVD
jgi:hypothetical protein